MSIECAQGLDAAKSRLNPFSEIPPHRRVSIDQFSKRLELSKSALESRIRRGRYRQPTIIGGRGYFDAGEVDGWVRVERKRRGLNCLEIEEPGEVASHRALGEIRQTSHQ
jgi:hypothetical protein